MAAVVFCGRSNVPADFDVRSKALSLVSCVIDDYFGTRRCKWAVVEVMVSEEASMC